MKKESDMILMKKLTSYIYIYIYITKKMGKYRLPKQVITWYPMKRKRKVTIFNSV